MTCVLEYITKNPQETKRLIGIDYESFQQLIVLPNGAEIVDVTVGKPGPSRDSYENLQLLHRHCHDVKSALDDKAEGMGDKHQFIEEPCAGKLASTVLQTSRVGDNPA